MSLASKIVKLATQCKECEQLRVQLAGCGVAAELRRKYDKLLEKKASISRKYFNYEDKTGFHNWKVSDIHQADRSSLGKVDIRNFQIRDNLSSNRVKQADLNYPIILSKDFIVDGQHRIAKARLLGITKLPAEFINLKDIKETSR